METICIYILIIYTLYRILSEAYFSAVTLHKLNNHVPFVHGFNSISAALNTITSLASRNTPCLLKVFAVTLRCQFIVSLVSAVCFYVPAFHPMPCPAITNCVCRCNQSWPCLLHLGLSVTGGWSFPSCVTLESHFVFTASCLSSYLMAYINCACPKDLG